MVWESVSPFTPPKMIACWIAPRRPLKFLVRTKLTVSELARYSTRAGTSVSGNLIIRLRTPAVDVFRKKKNLLYRTSDAQANFYGSKT